MVSTMRRAALRRSAKVGAYAEDARNAKRAVCAVAAYQSGRDAGALSTKADSASKPLACVATCGQATD